MNRAWNEMRRAAKRGPLFLSCALSILAALLAAPLRAQQSTTISDAIVGATGNLTITAAQTFTTADGYVVAAGTKWVVALSASGQFTVTLYPTVGASPYNAFYYADYKTSAAQTREEWALPRSAAAVNLAAVRVLWPKAPSVLVPANQLQPPPGCLPIPSGSNIVLRATSPFVGWTCGPDNLGAVSMDLENPTAADAGKFQWKPKNALVLTRVSCDTDQGTVSVNFDLRTEAAPNTPGQQLLAASLSCNPSGAATTQFSASSVGGLAPVALLVTGTSGAPTIVRVYAEYQLN